MRSLTFNLLRWVDFSNQKYVGASKLRNWNNIGSLIVGVYRTMVLQQYQKVCQMKRGIKRKEIGASADLK